MAPPWMQKIGGLFSDPRVNGGVFGEPTAASPYDPRMAMASELLSQSGYAPYKRPFGEVLGRAMQAAQQARALGIDREQQKKVQDAQIAASNAQAARAQSGPSVNNIDPEGYEPDSVQAFVDSGGKDYRLLKPRANIFGRYNPGDYTPDSWAQFQQTGDPSVLKRFAPNRILAQQGGGTIAVNPLDPTNPQTVVSNQEGAGAAAARAGAEAQARAAGEATGKAEGGVQARATAAEGVLGVLDLVDPLIDASTGSLAGAGRDKLAGVFGAAPDAAQANAQLKVLQATLMTQQPRMEGPQSDRDVQLYREAAGQIGDPTVPAGIKKAASAMIRALNMYYIGRASGAGGDETQPYAKPSPSAGEVVDGYRFKGGDPSQQSSWEKQ